MRNKAFRSDTDALLYSRWAVFPQGSSRTMYGVRRTMSSVGRGARGHGNLRDAQETETCEGGEEEKGGGFIHGEKHVGSVVHASMQCRVGTLCYQLIRSKRVRFCNSFHDDRIYRDNGFECHLLANLQRPS